MASVPDSLYDAAAWSHICGVYHQTSFLALTTDVSRHVAEVSGVDKLVICDCDDPQENQGEAGSRTLEKYEKHIYQK